MLTTRKKGNIKSEESTEEMARRQRKASRVNI
jgi:hypothetical protein